MALTFIRSNRPDSAFTAAITFLAAQKPFDRMPLGPIVATVSGAIQRGHYVLAVEDGRTVVGLTCWALTDYDTALAWSRGQVQPTFEQTCDGDTVMMMMGGGDGPGVALGGLRHIGDRYPGQRYVMNRFDRDRPSLGRFPPVREGATAPAAETAFGE